LIPCGAGCRPESPLRPRSPLVLELKRALREQGLGYRDVAPTLGLSLASVKRLFSTGHFTLERLEEVCALAKLSLAELAARAEARASATAKLSYAQEQEIVADPKLFLVTWLILNRAGFEDITRSYALTERELLHYLIRLDRLKVIELQPNNRVKLLVDRHFNWLPDGPVQAYLFDRLLQEFLSTRFRGEGEEFYFHGGRLTASALAQLRRVIRSAATDCVEQVERDRATPGEREGAAFVLALRPWNYSGFSRLLRE
jgi:hypothetical protein